MRWLLSLVALLPFAALGQSTENFGTNQDPLSGSANWDQCGVNGVADSGQALSGEFFDGSGNSNDKCAFYVGTFGNDQYSQIQWSTDPGGTPSDRLGVMVRTGSGNAGILIRFMLDVDQFAAYYWNGGSRTQIGSNYTPSATFTVGDTMRAEIAGTTLTLKIDYGAGFVTETTFDASSGPSSGNPGIYIVDDSTTTAGDNWEGDSLVSATRDQEGFRWGIDDGNEASHTFEAAQDTNITIADNQSRLIRTLVNATLDPASAAYTLRYQKNGSGGYTAVPVGSTTNGSISNQTVAASADDAQQSGTTVTINGTTIGASLDASTEYVGMRFTNITIPPGSTITSAAMGVVPSGTGEDEPNVLIWLEDADDCAAFTTGASNITTRAATTATVAWSSTDLGASGSSYHDTPSLVTPLQEVVDRAGWASGNDLCVIIQGGQGAATRDLTIEAQDLGPNTNPPRISIGWTAPNQVYVTTSANITAGGEATTARLTAPSGKTTSDFVTGRRWDDENGTDSIDITTDDYTEVEWLVFIASSAADGDFFDFRTYAGAAALDTYTVTPRWTIPSAASGLLRRRRAFH
jgi:hypothetical protein